MGKWSAETANWLNEKDKTAAQIAERQRQERECLNENSHRLWDELREWLKDECPDLNRRLGRDMLHPEIGPNKELMIRVIDKGQALHLRYDSEAMLVEADFRGSNAKSLRFLVSVVASRTVLFLSDKDDPYTAQGLGRLLLDVLVGKNETASL